MLHGANVEDSEYLDETLPYAEAGMVVIHYSIDGAVPEHIDQNNQDAYMTAIRGAYPLFKKSAAGTVNGRNALDFAIHQLPMVDPNRIYTAGHSSAGALSLLLAAYEPRVNRCIAYAAAYDLESRMLEMTSDPGIRSLLPGIKSFIKSTSPKNHIDRIKCPVFIFHARDDSNVPFADAKTFVANLSAINSSVTFNETSRGEHYQSMISEGIPTAINWLDP